MLADLVEKYVLQPMYKGDVYNPITTSINVISFAVFSYLLYKALLKLKVKIDDKFILATIPIVSLGTLARFSVDLNILPRSPLTVTPGIWIEFLLLALLLLYIDQKRGYNLKLFSALPSILAIIAFSIISMNLHSFDLLVPFSLLYFGSLYFYFTLLQILNLKNRIFVFPGIGQILDATTAVINIFLKEYIEEHYVTSYIIYDFPEIYIAIKVLLTLGIVYLCRDMDKTLRNYIYMLIFILGFGPGLRNLLLMLL